MNTLGNIVELMHHAIVEALKESKPGTPEWDFCMTSLYAYESWYLGKEMENKNEGLI